MYTFTFTKNTSEYKWDLGGVTVEEDGVYKYYYGISKFDYNNEFWFVHNGEIDKTCGSIEEVIDKIKSFFDPFNAAMDRIDASINANIDAMKHKLDLRIAEFRGFLFNQRVVLKMATPVKKGDWSKALNALGQSGFDSALMLKTFAERMSSYVTSDSMRRIGNYDMPIGTRVMCLSDADLEWINCRLIMRGKKPVTRGRVLTVCGTLDLPRGLALQFEEIDLDIFVRNRYTTDYVMMPAPFLKKRFIREDQVIPNPFNRKSR